MEGASGYPKSTGLYSKRLVNRKRIAQNFYEGSARAEKLNEAQDFGLSSLINNGLSTLNITERSVGEQFGDCSENTGGAGENSATEESIQFISPPLFRPGFSEREENPASNRRYSTRASNKTWSWKKAARYKTGESIGHHSAEGNCSRGRSRRSNPDPKDFH